MDNFVLGAFAIVFIFYTAMNIAVHSYDNSYTDDCHNAGGVAVITPRKNHCLNPIGIIRLEREK